jgi:hypothetical protein
MGLPGQHNGYDGLDAGWLRASWALPALLSSVFAIYRYFPPEPPISAKSLIYLLIRFPAIPAAAFSRDAPRVEGITSMRRTATLPDGAFPPAEANG